MSVHKLLGYSKKYEVQVSKSSEQSLKEAITRDNLWGARKNPQVDNDVEALESLQKSLIEKRYVYMLNIDIEVLVKINRWSYGGEEGFRKERISLRFFGSTLEEVVEAATSHIETIESVVIIGDEACPDINHLTK